jgi:hypothetical protein
MEKLSLVCSLVLSLSLSLSLPFSLCAAAGSDVQPVRVPGSQQVTRARSWMTRMGTPMLARVRRRLAERGDARIPAACDSLRLLIPRQPPQPCGRFPCSHVSLSLLHSSTMVRSLPLASPPHPAPSAHPPAPLSPPPSSPSARFAPENSRRSAEEDATSARRSARTPERTPSRSGQSSSAAVPWEEAGSVGRVGAGENVVRMTNDGGSREAWVEERARGDLGRSRALMDAALALAIGRPLWGGEGGPKRAWDAVLSAFSAHRSLSLASGEQRAPTPAGALSREDEGGFLWRQGWSSLVAETQAHDLSSCGVGGGETCRALLSDGVDRVVD